MPEVGFQCVMYRNAGSYGAPSWNEMPNVKDATLPMDATEVDVTTRGNGGYEAVIQGLIKTGIEFKMVWDPSDPDFTAIQQAFFARTSIDMLILDGAVGVSGSQGLRAVMVVTKFPRSEPLDGAVEIDISMKPTYVTDSGQKPRWYTSAGT